MSTFLIFAIGMVMLFSGLFSMIRVYSIQRKHKENLVLNLDRVKFYTNLSPDAIGIHASVTLLATILGSICVINAFGMLSALVGMFFVGAAAYMVYLMIEEFVSLKWIYYSSYVLMIIGLIALDSL